MERPKRPLLRLLRETSARPIRGHTEEGDGDEVG